MWRRPNGFASWLSDASQQRASWLRSGLRSGALASPSRVHPTGVDRQSLLFSRTTRRHGILTRRLIAALPAFEPCWGDWESLRRWERLALCSSSVREHERGYPPCLQGPTRIQTETPPPGCSTSITPTMARSDRSLPRKFFYGVWLTTLLGVILVVFWVPLFNVDCPTPCDWGGFVIVGLVQLALVVLLIAKIAWLVLRDTPR
jgi:hypothetical protein